MSRLNDYNPTIQNAMQSWKMYAAQTGSAPEEIKPYKLNENVVGFRLRRDRLDFVREKDAITRLVLKTPDITLEAPKK